MKLFNSSDANANGALFIFACSVGLIFLALGAAVALPVLAVVGIVKGIHWYITKPPTTNVLLAQTEALTQRAGFPSPQAFQLTFVDHLIEHFNGQYPAYDVLIQMAQLAQALYISEDLIDPLEPYAAQNTIEEGKYRDQLLTRARKTASPTQTLDLMHQTLIECFSIFKQYLPANALSDNLEKSTGRYSIPLIDIIPNVGQIVYDITLPFFTTEVLNADLFRSLRDQLNNNILTTKKGKDVVSSVDHKGTPEEIVRTYLAATPLQALFNATVSFDFVDKLDEHALLLAATGWGKSQFIQSLTLRLLSEPDPPSIIILNSQGSMLDKIQRLAIFAPGQPLSDRLVIIDPEHENPPALNMFALPTERTKTYSRNIREQVEVGVTETFEYMASSIDNDFTGKQGNAFNYLVSLVLSMPNGSFDVFLDLLQETTKDPKGKDSKYASDIQKLDARAQGFFENQYFTKSFTTTRQEIGQRVYKALNRPAFARMFTSSENRLDLFTLMERGSVILCNTSKTILGDKGSAFFGRWIVSMLMRAAYERVAVEHPRRTLLLIDEASDYVDVTFEKILSKVRQFNVGCLMAFQDTSQIPILRPLLSNTTVKLAGGVSDHDARAIASDMRTTKEFLMDMHQTKTSTQFATHVRGMPSSVRIEIPYFTVENAPKMTDAEHEAILERNRERYSATPPETPPPEPIVTFTPRPPEIEPSKLDSADKNDDEEQKPTKEL